MHNISANIIANTDGHIGRFNEPIWTETWKNSLIKCAIVIKPKKTPETIR